MSRHYFKYQCGSYRLVCLNKSPYAYAYAYACLDSVYCTLKINYVFKNKFNIIIWKFRLNTYPKTDVLRPDSSLTSTNFVLCLQFLGQYKSYPKCNLSFLLSVHYSPVTRQSLSQHISPQQSGHKDDIFGRELRQSQLRFIDKILTITLHWQPLQGGVTASAPHNCTQAGRGR